MMKRTVLAREWSSESKTRGELTRLEVELARAVDQSVDDIAAKVDVLVKKRLEVLTDQNA